MYSHWGDKHNYLLQPGRGISNQNNLLVIMHLTFYHTTTRVSSFSELFILYISTVFPEWTTIQCRDHNVANCHRQIPMTLILAYHLSFIYCRNTQSASFLRRIKAYDAYKLEQVFACYVLTLLCTSGD